MRKVSCFPPMDLLPSHAYMDYWSNFLFVSLISYINFGHRSRIWWFGPGSSVDESLLRNRTSMLAFPYQTERYAASILSECLSACSRAESYIREGARGVYYPMSECSSNFRCACMSYKRLYTVGRRSSFCINSIFLFGKLRT